MYYMHSILILFINLSPNFNELKPRLKSPKNRFQFSAGLNLEKISTILSEANHIWAAA